MLASRMSEGHVKGALLVHLRGHVVRRAGQEAWDRLVAGSSAVDREHLGSLLLTGSWYPVGVWNRGLAAYLATRPPEAARDEVIAFSERVADNDMHVLFKIALRMANPSMVASRAGSMWSRYFDRGTLTPTELAPASWRLKLEAPTDEEQGPGEPLCAHGVIGWAQQALRLTGAKHVVVEHSKCRFAFSRYCEYRVTW
jgi:hypothetical protein